MRITHKLNYQVYTVSICVIKSSIDQKLSAFFMNARLMHVIKFSLFFNVQVLRR